MAQGLDYAFAHPDLSCAKAQGFTFVARYVGDADPNPVKYLDAPELAHIRRLGLSVVVVRETTEGFMLTDSGATHARVSRAHCEALGLHGIPIYYALDVDPRGLTTAQRAAVTRFLQAAAAADGGGQNVGIYGSDDALDWWAGQPFCHWGWQTYAWSAGRVSPHAHFRQYRNGVALCGGTVDLNVSYRPDFGQWPRPQESDELTPEDRAWIEAQFTGNAMTIVAALEERVIGKATKRVNFVQDPGGRSVGVWVVGEMGRWLIADPDNDGFHTLEAFQLHFASHGQDVAIVEWTPAHLGAVPILGQAAPALAAVLNASGTLTGEIRLNVPPTDG